MGGGSVEVLTPSRAHETLTPPVPSHQMASSSPSSSSPSPKINPTEYTESQIKIKRTPELYAGPTRLAPPEALSEGEEEAFAGVLRHFNTGPPEPESGGVYKLSFKEGEVPEELEAREKFWLVSVIFAVQ